MGTGWRVLPALLVGFCAVAAMTACQSEEFENYPKPCQYAAPDEDCVGDVPATPDATDAGGDTDAGPSPLVGMACEAAGDCPLGTCLNKAFLDPLVCGGAAPEDNCEAPEVPNGMCSKLACADDEDCGPRGFCLDAGLIDPGAGGFKICLLTCDYLDDCRYAEDYHCFKPGPDVVDESLLPISVCLPQELILDIVCGDEGCEPTPEEGQP